MLMLLACLLTGWLMAPPVNAKDMPPGSPQQELLRQGNDFFRQANEAGTHDPETARQLLHKAVLRFERLARDHGVKNGRLYYNIGNCYFRLNDLGRAILNYRRALLYQPNDVNLLQNLDYARSQRLDRIEEQQQTRVLKTLLFWHYDFNSRTRLIILAICATLFWLTLALRLLIGRRISLWVMVVFGLPALLGASSLIIESNSGSESRAGVILSDDVVARKGNADTYQPSFKDPLHSGTEFIVLEQRGAWIQARLADGRQCWLPGASVELLQP